MPSENTPIIKISTARAISKLCNCCSSDNDVQGVELGRRYDEKSSSATVVSMCLHCRRSLYLVLGRSLG